MTILTALILAQILFYLSVSIVIVIIGILVCMALYALMAAAREIERISKSVHATGEEALAHIRSTAGTLSMMTIISWIMNHGKQWGKKKGQED